MRAAQTVRLVLLSAASFIPTFITSCAGFRGPGTSESGAGEETRIAAIYRLGLGPGDLLLESIEDFIREHDIQDGAVLTGIGSLSECSLHWPAKAEYPPTDVFETFKGPIEITSIQGIIAGGEPHLHMMVAEGGDKRAMGGHMEKGCRVLYLAEITIARFDGPPMTRRPNEHGVNMLQVQ